MSPIRDIHRKGWQWNSPKDRWLAVVSISVVAVSMFYLVKGIKLPNYGGDEVWFATPLLNTNLLGLHVFQFVYAGPLKTIITAPIFYLFGFTIYSVRLFTISVFLLSLLAWSLYLAQKNCWIALSATLIAASVNHDLLFFAKVDINQPTFHNAVTVCYFILFIGLLRAGANWWRALFFIGLSILEINNHIRNVWIINAFLTVTLLDFYFASIGPAFSTKNLRALIAGRWPVFAGWMIAVAYFVYTLQRFDGSPGLEAAKALGGTTSWVERFLAATSELAEFAIGGRVFAHAYAGRIEFISIIVLGGIFMISTTVLIGVSLRGKKAYDQWEKRLLLISFAVTLLVFLQYALTKSAIWPWHGNSLLLFITISFGLLVQSLVLNGHKRLATIYSICTIAVMCTVNIAAAIQINSAHPDRIHTGFNLAVWNLQALDEIRHYVLDNPNEYYVADWGIGRPLALESKYAPAQGVKVTLELEPLSSQLASTLGDALIIRATEIGRTVPDYSDEAISKVDNSLDFVVLRSFYDDYGREVYQVGFLERRGG